MIHYASDMPPIWIAANDEGTRILPDYRPVIWPVRLLVLGHHLEISWLAKELLETLSMEKAIEKKNYLKTSYRVLGGA